VERGLERGNWSYAPRKKKEKSARVQVYINRVLRGELSYAEHTTTTPERRRLHAGAGARFLVGFADDVDAASAPPLYGDFIVDEVELWFQDRDTLLAFGYIDRGILRQSAGWCVISAAHFQTDGPVGRSSPSRWDGPSLLL